MSVRRVDSAALVIALAVGSIHATGGGPVGLDLGVRRLVLDQATDPVRGLARALSQLGSGAILFPVLLVVAARKRTWATAVLPLVLAIGPVAEAVLLAVLPVHHRDCGRGRACPRDGRPRRPWAGSWWHWHSARPPDGA